MPFSSSALTRAASSGVTFRARYTNCGVLAQRLAPCAWRIAASQLSSAPHTSEAVRSGSVVLARVGEDGVGVDAVGEHAAVAVEDLAALRRNVDGVELLAVGARLEVGMLHDLQVEEPRLDADGPDREQTPRPSAATAASRASRADAAPAAQRSQPARARPRVPQAPRPPIGLRVPPVDPPLCPPDDRLRVTAPRRSICRAPPSASPAR